MKKEVQILDEKQGIDLIKKFDYKKSVDYNEDKEHIYYHGKDSEFLVYNKYAKLFVLYKSKLHFEKFISNFENITDEMDYINFNDFEEKLLVRIEKLSDTLKTKLNIRDKLAELKENDNKINELIHVRDKDSIFIDLFSYYYIILKNELNFFSYEIQILNDSINFFIYYDGNKRKEIFSDFYRFFEDPDNEYNLSTYVENIINPMNFSFGDSKDAPIRE